MVRGMVHINKGPNLWLLHVADPIDRCCPSNEMYHHCQKLLIGGTFFKLWTFNFSQQNSELFNKLVELFHQNN